MFNNNSIILNNMNNNYQTNGGYYNNTNGYNHYNPYLANNQYQAALAQQREYQEMQNKIHNKILQNACNSMNISQEEFFGNQYTCQSSQQLTDSEREELELIQLQNMHFSQYETISEYENRMQSQNMFYNYNYNRQPMYQQLPEIPNVGIAELDKILAPTLELLEQEKVSNYRKNLSGTYGVNSYKDLVKSNSNGYGSYNNLGGPSMQVGGNFNLDDMTINLPPNLTSSTLDARRNAFLDSITIG